MKFINSGGLIVLATIVYGSNNENEREDIWEDLIGISRTVNGDRWILLDNFNEIGTRQLQ